MYYVITNSQNMSVIQKAKKRLTIKINKKNYIQKKYIRTLAYFFV